MHEVKHRLIIWPKYYIGARKTIHWKRVLNLLALYTAVEDCKQFIDNVCLDELLEDELWEAVSINGFVGSLSVMDKEEFSSGSDDESISIIGKDIHSGKFARSRYD